MAKWAAVFTRHHDDGTISQSDRVFVSNDDSAAAGAAIEQAMFTKAQNPGKEAVTYIERRD